jgi:excinuclease UvrABC ATPase subunit
MRAGLAPEVFVGRGVREYNLNIGLELPRDKHDRLRRAIGLGQSLPFDMVYAEGQRRFRESGCRRF